MNQDLQLLKGLYNTFDPFRPLEANDPAYVECEEVRGNDNILIQLGNEIILSDSYTYQLYTGHRGAGKSTELLRLKKDLEDNQYFVVYFAADEEDIEPEDTTHTDILFACTRHLLEYLKDEADVKPLIIWLKKRWENIKDLGSTEIKFDNVNIGANIKQFAKISAILRASPSTRQKVRQEVENHTPSLIEILNCFIKQAEENISKNYNGIVVIVDNLDRIAPVFDKEGKRSNHDQIFIDRSEQLRKLSCHMIYTVPISMVYSEKSTILEDRFGTIQALPMIMVKTPDEKEYKLGLDKTKELIQKRIDKVNQKLIQNKIYTVKTQKSLLDIFENDKVLNRLCLMSGGHVRNLILLIKTAIQWTKKLPITDKEAERAIRDLRKTFRRGINDNQWEILANVYLTKNKLNDSEHKKLLFNRSILEYPPYQNGNTWYDIHPLIFDIPEFQDALKSIKNQNNTTS